MTPPSIVFDGVVKRYGDTVALDGMSLAVHAGALTCLAGPNGAGKSTALAILMGLRNPTSGDVRILGTSISSRDIHRVRRNIGFMSEEPALYDELTPREHLDFHSALRGQDDGPRVERLLRELGLDDWADRPIGSLSMGNRRKVAFAAALLPEPDVLVLDEPTNGMDVAAARIAKDHLRAARDRGCVVLFTTHVMELAESLADEVAVLRDGRIVARDTPTKLREIEGRGSVTLEEAILDLTSRAPSTEGSSDGGRG